MVTLYAVDCTPWRDPALIERALPLLSPARCARVQRLGAELPRAQCAAAGLLLRRLFSPDGTPPALTHGAHGKPYLLPKKGEEPPFFSLSHTGGRVFCAVGERELGLDAETISPCRARVAERCFTPEERAWLSADPDARFARLWAAKEAYLKFTGLGLILPMSGFSVPPAVPPERSPGGCRFFEVTGTDTAADGRAVAVALCVTGNEKLGAVRELPPDELWQTKQR